MMQYLGLLDLLSRPSLIAFIFQALSITCLLRCVNPPSVSHYQKTWRPVYLVSSLPKATFTSLPWTRLRKSQAPISSAPTLENNNYTTTRQWGLQSPIYTTTQNDNSNNSLAKLTPISLTKQPGSPQQEKLHPVGKESRRPFGKDSRKRTAALTWLSPVTLCPPACRLPQKTCEYAPHALRCQLCFVQPLWPPTPIT